MRVPALTARRTTRQRYRRAGPATACAPTGAAHVPDGTPPNRTTARRREPAPTSRRGGAFLRFGLAGVAVLGIGAAAAAAHPCPP